MGHRIGQGWSVLSPAGSQMRALKQGPTLRVVEFASAPGTVAHLLQANLGVVLCRPMFRKPPVRSVLRSDSLNHKGSVTFWGGRGWVSGRGCITALGRTGRARWAHWPLKGRVILLFSVPSPKSKTAQFTGGQRRGNRASLARLPRPLGGNPPDEGTISEHGLRLIVYHGTAGFGPRRMRRLG